MVAVPTRKPPASSAMFQFETEVLPIDFCSNREARDGLAHRVRGGTVELHVECDLASARGWSAHPSQ